jgi:hypothetical protein
VHISKIQAPPRLRLRTQNFSSIPPSPRLWPVWAARGSGPSLRHGHRCYFRLLSASLDLKR